MENLIDRKERRALWDVIGAQFPYYVPTENQSKQIPNSPEQKSKIDFQRRIGIC